MKICFWYNQVCFLRVFLKDVFAAYIKIPRSKWPASTSASLELTGTGTGGAGGDIRDNPGHATTGHGFPCCVPAGHGHTGTIGTSGRQVRICVRHTALFSEYCLLHSAILHPGVQSSSVWPLLLIRSNKTQHHTHLSIHLVPLGGKMFTVQLVYW